MQQRVSGGGIPLLAEGTVGSKPELTASAPLDCVHRDEALLRAGPDHWLLFSEPREVVVTSAQNEVLPALEHVTGRVASEGYHAAGFVSYEAAGAFDAAFRTQKADDTPLLWFGVYPEPVSVELPAPPIAVEPSLPWVPDTDSTAHAEGIRRIKELIGSGDTYQVNYTLRLHSRLDDPWDFFLRTFAPLSNPYSAFIRAGDLTICSASPELFFELQDGVIRSRPMKGTRHRSHVRDLDSRLASELRTSPKDRAENVMITDMIRNDIGRIARTGSVHVPALFDVEAWPTVWQMTSTVEARTDASTPEIFRALFPCASITGAPKVRTMEIIRDLEPSARGLYTGAIGFMSPGRRARFSVAIRTAVVDERTHLATYGTGGGIVWDSVAEDEYRECLTKTAILHGGGPRAQLLETMLYVPGEGVWLLEEHLARLRSSAAILDYELDETQLRSRVAGIEDDRFLRIRLLLSSTGEAELQTAVLGKKDTRNASGRWRIARAARPVLSRDATLRHKTTARGVYARARAGRDDVDDVLLWNERDEITESTIANVAIERDGELVTPPLSSGLLPGTLRAHLLAKGDVVEGVVSKEEVRERRLWLLNSVRGWIAAELVE